MSVAEERSRLLRALKAYQRKREGRQDSFASVKDPPKGFSISPSGRHSLELKKTKSSNRSPGLFFIFVIWTGACLFLLYSALDSKDGTAFLLFIAFACFEAMIAIAVIKNYFEKPAFRFDRDSLLLEKETFGFKKATRIERNSIFSLSLRRDIPRLEQGVTSWDLSLLIPCREKVMLVEDVSREEGEWLARIVAEWGGVEIEDERNRPVPKAEAFEEASPPPKGFKSRLLEDGSSAITHKRPLGAMSIFLCVWLAFWTFACVILALGKFGTPEKNPEILIIGIPFFIAEIIVACLLSYMLFSKKSFVFEGRELREETNVFFLSWKKRFSRDLIERVVQIKDGGEGDDSFPSWGLKLFLRDGSSKTLLYRLPYEQSQWLGGVIGRWSGVNFEEAPPP